MMIMVTKEESKNYRISNERNGDIESMGIILAVVRFGLCRSIIVEACLPSPFLYIEHAYSGTNTLDSPNKKQGNG
jgi:hypothetical protein